jgi:putative transcriptional regulator
MLAQAQTMAIKSALAKIIARENLRRAEAGQKPLSQAQIARDSGVPQSVISTLAANKSRRIDFATINGLCSFFNVPPGELFDYTPDTTD